MSKHANRLAWAVLLISIVLGGITYRVRHPLPVEDGLPVKGVVLTDHQFDSLFSHPNAITHDKRPDTLLHSHYGPVY